MNLICYKRVFSTEKEADSELRKVKDKASNPKVIKGNAGNTWLVQLYECSSDSRLEEGMRYFRGKELDVFRYKR